MDIFSYLGVYSVVPVTQLCDQAVQIYSILVLVGFVVVTLLEGVSIGILEAQDAVDSLHLNGFVVITDLLDRSVSTCVVYKGSSSFLSLRSTVSITVLNDDSF